MLLIAICITGIALAFIGLVAHDLQLQRAIADLRRTCRPRNVGGFPLGWIDVPADIEDEDEATA